MYNYGLTEEDYFQMLEQQEGKCAICSTPTTSFTKALAVDHCHTTGQVRGLLCPLCNKGLGLFRDKISFLQRATDYLKKYEN